jgi:hypothetical protein
MNDMKPAIRTLTLGWATPRAKKAILRSSRRNLIQRTVSALCLSGGET